jgi:large subunit ribosomal protein L5
LSTKLSEPKIRKQPRNESKEKKGVEPIMKKVIGKKVSKSKTTNKENPMRIIKIAKVVLNIGIGQSGEIVERAKSLLQDLTGQNPSSRNAERTVKEFGIHKGEPIGVTVTLRGKNAFDVLKRLLEAKNNQVSKSSFDRTGNFSFGIREHIEIPGVKYDPAIGIFGMDVSVVLERPGARVMKRKRASSRVGSNHKVTADEAIEYFKTQLGIEVI